MAVSSARRWFLIERKSFEVVLEGRQNDKVRFTEFRRGGRSSICLNLEEARWFAASWPSISKEPRVAGRCARYRKGERCLFLSMHCNDFGWFIKLLEVGKGAAHTVVFPEGHGGSGWVKVRASSEEIFKARPEIHLKAAEIGRAQKGFPPLPQSSQIHKVEQQTSQIHKAEPSQRSPAFAWGSAKEAVTMRVQEAAKICVQVVPANDVQRKGMEKEKEKETKTSFSNVNIRFDCPCCKGCIEGTLSFRACDLRGGCSGGVEDFKGDGEEASFGAAVNARGSHAAGVEKARQSSVRPNRSGLSKPNSRKAGGGKRRLLLGPIGKFYKPKLGCITKEGFFNLVGSKSAGLDFGPLVPAPEPEMLPFSEGKPDPAVSVPAATLVSIVLPEDLSMEMCVEPLALVPYERRGEDEFQESSAEIEVCSTLMQEDPPSPVGSLADSVGELAMVIFEPKCATNHGTLDAALVDPPPVDLDGDPENVLSELSMRLDVSFEGFEDEALALIGAIKNNRPAEKVDPPSKTSRELKRLAFGVNYEKGSVAKKGAARGSGRFMVGKD